MKRLFIGLIAVFMIIGLVACAGLNQPAEQVVLQIVAQRIGYQVAKNNPAIVPQAKLIAQGVLANQNADLSKLALQAAIDALINQFPNDPLLASDIQLIVSGLNLKIPTAKFDLAALTPIINAFISGLDIGVAVK